MKFDNSLTAISYFLTIFQDEVFSYFIFFLYHCVELGLKTPKIRPAQLMVLHFFLHNGKFLGNQIFHQFFSMYFAGSII